MPSWMCNDKTLSDAGAYRTIMIEIRAQLIADDKIRRNQRKKMMSDQGRIAYAWDAFEDGDTTPKEILIRRSC